MGVRAENALIRANIRSIRQLTQRMRSDIGAVNISSIPRVDEQGELQTGLPRRLG
jgi:hypothetical protein